MGLIYSNTEKFADQSMTLVSHNTYLYDSQSRLVGQWLTDTYDSEIVSNTWRYDDASQIISTTSWLFTGPPDAITTTIRQYDDGGQLLGMKTYATGQPNPIEILTTTYDLIGNRVEEVRYNHNLTFTTSTNYVYDQANHLTVYTDVFGFATGYEYNGDGLRVNKRNLPPTTPAEPITYTWDVLGVGAGGLPLLLREDATEGTQNLRTSDFYYGLGSTPEWAAGYITQTASTAATMAGVAEPTPIDKGSGNDVPQNATPWETYLTDASGNVRMVFGAGGGGVRHVESVFEYGAYGGRSCMIPTNIGFCYQPYPHFGYSGQYQDDESGLVYLRARYYDPGTQQFISRDPAVGRTGQPYGYANGNPINYTDPAGLWPGSLSEQTGPKGPIVQEGRGGTWNSTATSSGLLRGASSALAGAGLEAGPPTSEVVAAGLGQLSNAIAQRRIRPINYTYVGKVFFLKDPELSSKYPEGVRFTERGFPDFSPYAKAEVNIRMKGNLHSDYRAANRAIGIGGRAAPYGYRWHHHENRTTMQLVPTDLHEAVRHTGGEALIRHLGVLP